MLKVTIEQDALRVGERFAVAFQRTLRIPADDRVYPLPPGFGAFPIFRVEDYADRVPPQWREQRGVFIPMYQREALWLNFNAASWKPNAVKMGAGGINAISGEPFDEMLRAAPQDYIVCPDQPWLDGFNTGQGTIRQFVAMPLGLGYTVEAALTGKEEFGGIQIIVFEPKPGIFPEQPPPQPERGGFGQVMYSFAAQPMGLGAGGEMKQKIYPDPHGIATWDEQNYGRVAVHILNSAQFQEVTGMEAPATPIDAKTYTEYGLPWFDLYDESRGDVSPAPRLAGAKTIAARDRERDEAAEEPASFEVPDSKVKKLQPEDSHGRTGRATGSPDA